MWYTTLVLLLKLIHESKDKWDRNVEKYKLDVASKFNYKISQLHISFGQIIGKYLWDFSTSWMKYFLGDIIFGEMMKKQNILSVLKSAKVGR